MLFDKIPVSKLRKAQIRYYEKGKGCEIPEVEAYTFFLKVGDTYVNLVHPYDECNVYMRTPYSNSTEDGEDYGTLISLVSGKEEDGICYVLESRLNAFEHRDSVYVEEIEREIVSNYNVFYFDRWDLAFGDRKDCTSAFERLRIKRLDSKKREKILGYINDKNKEKELQKIKNV